MARAAIFDMDGLMYDTERVTLDAWLYAADNMGFALTKEQCDSFRGTNREYKEQLFDKWYDGKVDYDKAFQIRQQYIDDYIKEQGVPVKKGLYDLMQALKEKEYKIAVATSTSRKKAEIYWKETKIDKYLDVNVCGDEVTKSKPNPEIFVKAAEKLNLPIEECIILEDSFNGIEAANAAGGIVVMVPDLLPPTEEIKKKCSFIFEDLEKVISIL